MVRSDEQFGTHGLVRDILAGKMTSHLEGYEYVGMAAV